MDCSLSPTQPYSDSALFEVGVSARTLWQEMLQAGDLHHAALTFRQASAIFVWDVCLFERQTRTLQMCRFVFFRFRRCAATCTGRLPEPCRHLETQA